MAQYFGDQARALQAALQEAGSVRSAETLLDEIFDVREWDRRLKETVRPVLETLMHDGAIAELEAAPRKQTVALSPEVQAAIDAELMTIMDRPYWHQITLTIRQRLTETLAEGIAAGESEYELIVRIGDHPTVPGVTDGVLGSQSNTVRAANIARTESTMALNAGHYQQQQELIDLGLGKGRLWHATTDQYTRASHLANHGKRSSEAGLFDVGEHPARYPGDPSLPAEERCSCRCTVLME